MNWKHWYETLRQTPADTWDAAAWLAHLDAPSGFEREGRITSVVHHDHLEAPGRKRLACQSVQAGLYRHRAVACWNNDAGEQIIHWPWSGNGLVALQQDVIVQGSMKRHADLRESGPAR